jgi:uncharacterized integral membrane protein
MRTLLRIVLAGVVALYTAWIVSTNGDPVTVTLGFRTLESVPLWMPLVAALVIGLLVAGVLLMFPLLRLRFQLRRQSRRVAELEQEIHGLRKLPIGGDPVESRGPPRGS